MSIQRDPDGRRSVHVEVEVPGTPEQVWQAIASGPGISAWFVPTKVDPKVGGEIVSDFGGGMVSTAKITALEPPFRLRAEDPGWMPGMPPVATEWTVEARSGGTCVVRVVHSLFASTDDWDGQLEGTETGWPTYFRVLRRYLERFAGQPSAQVLAMAMSSVPVEQAWSTLSTAMQLPAPEPGQRFRAVLGDLAVAGEVVSLAPQGEGKGNAVFATLTEPCPGTLMFGAYSCGAAMASLQVFLYGDGAEPTAAASREGAQRWLQEMFPAPATPPE